VKLIHARQKSQHRCADIVGTVRKEVGSRMAVIVMEGDDRSFRETGYGLAYRLGRRSLIACHHQDAGRQCPKGPGVQAGWTYERQGSNRLWTGRGETMPVCWHAGCDMHLFETEVPEKLHQSPVDRTFRVGRHMLARGA
jgi:hypothetical protein